VGQDVGLNAFPGIFSGTRRVGLQGKSPPDGNLNWFEISINCLPSKRKEKWKEALAEKGVSLEDVWRNNDAYHALQAVEGLVITGPTGTNVNDVCIGLIDGK
jgi:hypothetical protein